MSRILDRYLKILRAPQPDPDALAALEQALADHGDHASLVTALKSRLQVLEERDGPQPLSLSLRKRVADALMTRAQSSTDDDDASHAAMEAMEVCATDLNDVDGLKRAALLGLVRGAGDAHVRRAVSERMGGPEFLLKELKRALKGETDRLRKAALSHASALFKEEAGDRDGVFADLMRAVRARPEHRAYVDELFRVAVESERAREAEALLAEVSASPAEDQHAARAYLLTKLGTLRVQLGDDAGALDAFTRALAHDPELKGALKQAKRLSEKLGVAWSPPAPSASPPAPAPAPPVAAEEPDPDSILAALRPAPGRHATPSETFKERTGVALLADLPPMPPAPVVLPAEAAAVPPPSGQPATPAEAPDPLAQPLPRLLAHGFSRGEPSSVSLAPVPLPPYHANSEITGPEAAERAPVVHDERTAVDDGVPPASAGEGTDAATESFPRRAVPEMPDPVPPATRPALAPVSRAVPDAVDVPAARGDREVATATPRALVVADEGPRERTLVTHEPTPITAPPDEMTSPGTDDEPPRSAERAPEASTAQALEPPVAPSAAPAERSATDRTVVADLVSSRGATGSSAGAEPVPDAPAPPVPSPPVISSPPSVGGAPPPPVENTVMDDPPPAAPASASLEDAASPTAPTSVSLPAVSAEPSAESAAPLEPPPPSNAQDAPTAAQVPATPGVASTVEEAQAAGQWERAAELLVARVAVTGRVADMFALAEIQERRLGTPADALQMLARAATRLGERGDPSDPMLARAVEGALRVGKANAPGLATLAESLVGKLPPALHARLVRAAAAGLQADSPHRAAQMLMSLYVQSPDAPADLYEETDRALGLCRNPAGQAELRRLARARTSDPRARLLLDRERAELLRQVDTASFAAALVDVLEDDPADGAALEKLLHALEAGRTRGEPLEGQLEEALQLAARLQRGEQGLPHVRKLGRLRESRGDFPGAALAWRDVLARRPGDAEALKALGDALSHLATRDPARADELRDVLQTRLGIARNRRDRATEAELLEQLAQLAATRGDEEARTQALRQLLDASPDDDAALQVVEAQLLDTGRYAELEELFAQLGERRTTPAGRLGALLAAAQLNRQRLERPNRARELLAQVLKLDPDHLDARLQLGELAADAGNTMEAVGHLEKAAARQRGALRAATLVRLGQLHLDRLEQPDVANRHLREALAADPTHRPALEALLALAERTGRTQDVRTVAADLAAMETDPVRRAGAFVALARKAQEAGDLDGAARLFDLGVAADPTRMDAVEELASLHVARGDGRRARPLLERLVAARGVDGVAPALLVSLAKTLWSAGENGAAKDRLRAALRKDPSMLEALRALADLMLADRDDAAETLSILDLRVLHHGERLDKDELAHVHAHAGRLRAQLKDAAGAVRSLKRALALMPADRPDPDTLLLLARLTEESGRVDEAAGLYTRLAQRLTGHAAAEHWVKVGTLAKARGQAEEAARAFQEARKADPTRSDAARFLLDVEMARGNSTAAIDAMVELLEKEPDPEKKVSMHLALARIHREGMAQDEQAALHLRRALEISPANKEALGVAEQLFLDRKDPRGLAGVYTTSIRALPPDDTAGRMALWEKVALLRRYELKDLAGTADALGEILKLDEDNAKAREDLARLLAELGAPEKALAAWRALLVRDPLCIEAYRGMLGIYRRQSAYDAAYCVCATLAALEEADDDARAAVRALRPPFPTWPRPAADADALARRLVHPRAAPSVRELLGGLAPHVLSQFAPAIGTLGLGPRQELDVDDAPPSFSLAAKHAARLLGLQQVVLYRSDAAPSGIRVVVADRSGLLLGADVLKGGMTPERAFLFSRAALMLRPEALLAEALGPTRLRHVVEALVLRSNPSAEVESDKAELDRLARDMEKRVPPGEWPRLLLLAREWWKERTSHPLAELPAALAFTADRVGFLFAQDLGAGVNVLRQAGTAAHPAGLRAAIRELVLFSVSPELFALRAELGPSVNAVTAARVFGEG